MPFGVVFTLALSESLYHADGQWEINAAVRDLYAYAEPVDNLEVWIGSRVYRGRHVYLFDCYPVRDLPTIGGGAGFRLNDSLRFAAHVGWNILENNPRIVQDIVVPHPRYPTTISQRYLERQRFIASLQSDIGFGGGFLLALNGELHTLPAGDWINPATSTAETIPSEVSFKLGAGLTLSDFIIAGRMSSSVHGFASVAAGYAAYGMFGIPIDYAADETAGNAFEALFGVSSELEFGFFGLHAAAYARRFEDADSQKTLDLDDRWEWAVAARPEFYLGQVFRLGGELSFQRAVPDGIFASSNKNEALDIFKVTVFGALAANNDYGLKSSPKLQLFFTTVFLSGPAREWLDDYVIYDTPADLEFFFGLSAEWKLGETGGGL
jgi:maltoporin